MMKRIVAVVVVVVVVAVAAVNIQVCIGWFQCSVIAYFYQELICANPALSAYEKPILCFRCM